MSKTWQVKTPPLYPGMAGCLVLSLTASGACGVIPVRDTLGAWVGRAGIWTRTLKFICLWNSESRICGSVTIPHTSPSIFQSEHFRFWFYTFRARYVYNSSPSSDTLFAPLRLSETTESDGDLVSGLDLLCGSGKLFNHSSLQRLLHQAVVKGTGQSDREGAKGLSLLSMFGRTVTTMALNHGVPTVDPMWVCTQPA